MNEEELRAKIIELETKITELETTNTTHQTTYKELEDKYELESKMYEERVNDLKQYNKELFLKVSTQPKKFEEEEEKDDTKSLDDVISSFL